MGLCFLNKMGGNQGGGEVVICASGNFGDSPIASGSTITPGTYLDSEYIAISMPGQLTSNATSLRVQSATNSGVGVWKINDTTQNVSAGAVNARVAWIGFKIV